MDRRTASARWLPQLVAGLDAFNRRHPWSHNDHFHPWILRHLPEARGRALDVGCGRGELLAQLAGRFTTAHGTDLDAAMQEAAADRCRGLPNVTVDGRQLTELAGPYDLITMVAVLHHLETRAALGEVRRLLGPGGRFLVVGLAPPVGPTDWLWDIASSVANPVIGLVKHPRVAAPPPSATAFPVAEPTVPFARLKECFEAVLPGAHLRHRLAFRYTAEWVKPRPRLRGRNQIRFGSRS